MRERAIGEGGGMLVALIEKAGQLVAHRVWVPSSVTDLPRASCWPISADGAQNSALEAGLRDTRRS